MAPISIFYQNVRGLRTKTGVFYRNICMYGFDVICLTETWLTDGISDSELFDDRYMVWRRDRDYTSTGQTMGGGVLIAVRREIVAHARGEWHSSAEDLWVTLSLQQKRPRTTYKMHICVVYICSQNLGNSLTTQLGNFSDNLANIIMEHPVDKFIVLGDFNQPNLTWTPASDGCSLHPTNLKGQVQTTFFDNMNACNLLQYNCHSNKNNRILDLVFSNNEVSVSCSMDPLVPEDPHHNALCITADFVQLHSLPARPYVKYLYRSADYAAIKDELNIVDWQYELALGSLDDAVAFFYDVLYKVHNTYIPSKTVVSQSKYPLWYKSPLVKIIKEKSKFHAKFKKYGNDSDYQSFVILRQRAKELEKCMFDEYMTNVESAIRNNPRAFWSYIKSKKQNNSYPSVLRFGNLSSSNGEEICNFFGEYFLSNFRESTSSENNAQYHYTSEWTDYSPYDIASIEVCEDEVMKLLKHLDLNKSAGPDKLPPVFIVNCAASLSVPLTILFRRSLM